MKTYLGIFLTSKFVPRSHSRRQFTDEIKNNLRRMALKFPICERKQGTADVFHHPYFSKPIKTVRSSKSGFVLAGGILTILSSLACVPLGLFYIFFGFASNWGEYSNYPPDYWSLLIGILCILGLVLGLTGGIMAIIMRKFAFAMIGPSLISIAAFTSALYIYVATGGVEIGMPSRYAILLLALALLDIIFVELRSKSSANVSIQRQCHYLIFAAA